MHNTHKMLRSIAPLLLLIISTVAYSKQASFKQGVIIPHWIADLTHEKGQPNPFALTEEAVQWLSGQGFDHLRINLDSYLLNDDANNFDVQKLQPMRNAINWSKKYNLGIVMAVTSLPGYGDYPRGTTVDRDAPMIKRR